MGRGLRTKFMLWEFIKNAILKIKWERFRIVAQRFRLNFVRYAEKLPFWQMVLIVHVRFTLGCYYTTTVRDTEFGEAVKPSVRRNPNSMNLEVFPRAIPQVALH